MPVIIMFLALADAIIHSNGDPGRLAWSLHELVQCNILAFDASIRILLHAFGVPSVPWGRVPVVLVPGAVSVGNYF